MNKFNIVKIPIFAIVFLFVVLIMNYSSVDFKIDEMFLIKKMSEAKNDLADATGELTRLNQEIVEHEKKVKALEEDLDSLINKNLEIYSSLSELGIICGRTDVRGPGITIRVADNLSDDDYYYDINYKIVHYIDVIMIINELNSAGAEAIAVNGKRIVNTTEVICIGPVIKINGEAVAAPFIIKAIGDPDTLMEEVVMSTKSYAYEIKTDFGIDITAIKSNDITISRNYEKIEINFAKLYKEGE